jgi:hypothetical protein
VADKDNEPVAQQMAGIDSRIRQSTTKHPAQMRVPETVNWAVGIALTVRLRVMLDMGRSPFQGWTFYRHGTEHKQDGLDDGVRSEAPVGQHPVEAHGHAKCDQRVQDEQKRKVVPGNSTLPKKADGESRGSQGSHHDYQNYGLGGNMRDARER